MSKHPDNYCPVFGNYPKEYNRAVHGPYYPWVNYGPKDTPIKDVKLGELKAWIARRDKSPSAVLAASSRVVHNYNRLWVNNRYGSPSKFIIQLIFMTGLASMCLSYSYYRNERTHKYHW